MKRKSANPGDVIPCPSIQEAALQAVRDDTVIDGLLFEQDALEDFESAMLDFTGCVFRHVRFAGLHVDRIHLSNCRFEQCDLSGMTFRDGTISRTEFITCRCTGCTFDRMKFKDALFRETQLRYFTLSDCHLERLAFEDCDLSHAILFHTAQKELELLRCSLAETELQETPLAGVDLSTCALEGISTVPELLRGTIISLDQAPLLIPLFGISIKL